VANERRERDRDGEGRGDHREKTVQIRRCACVVKGGRRFSFTALVVVGDGRGRVGYGYGKAGEVPNAIEKATKQGGRSMVSVPLVENTIPHEVIGRFRSSRVKLIPAKPGTGLKAGEAVRAVVESAGVSDILTKCYGSTNAMNVVKATFDALSRLRTRDQIARLRGVEV
jgi:small subunit ribosomal protein S5